MASSRSRRTLYLSEKFGSLALVSALLFFFFCPVCALFPLVFFLFLCGLAPFLPRFSFFLPIISCGRRGELGIGITFDDGPDPQSTPLILELLARYKMQATFFVVGRRVAEYPDFLQQIVAAGHSIGNHSWDHDYYLMLRSQEEIYDNVSKTQEILQKNGVKVLVFRPPVGITGPRLGKVLDELNLVAINFSCRALDRGNRRVEGMAGKILRRLRPGHIIMLHDLPPATDEERHVWQDELEQLVASLASRYEVKPLAQIIGRPV